MKENKLKITVKLLTILIIILISFFGVYKQDLNKMKNVIKSYNFINDLVGYRELIFKIQDSNSDNEEKESINKENLDKTKDILKNRLKSFGVEDYTIGIDYNDGSVYLKIPEDSNTDHTISNLFQVGKFEIKDENDTSKVLLSNDDLKKVSVYYNTTDLGGTIVNLKIEFNKSGKKTLEEISTGEYATKKENTNNENSEDSSENIESNTIETDEETNENVSEVNENETIETTEESQKKIIMSIDDNDLITTSFDEPIETGVIGMSLNAETTDEDTIKDSLQYASTISTILNSGLLPFEYTVAENVYTQTDIDLSLCIGIICIIAIILLIILIIKFKFRGVITSVGYIGYVALLLLLVRYTNVIITIESFVAGIILLIINYIITYNLLKIKQVDGELKNKEINEKFRQIIISIIPIFIISLIFVFVKWSKISSFGMLLFWGLILNIIYNYIVTRKMLD